MDKAIPFTQEALGGFLARTYDVPLDNGFETARQRGWKRHSSRTSGGGSAETSSGSDQLRSRFDAVTFKHILLPVWMLDYRFHGQAVPGLRQRLDRRGPGGTPLLGPEDRLRDPGGGRGGRHLHRVPEAITRSRARTVVPRGEW